MKFLIINTDYAEVFRWLSRQHVGLEAKSFDEQMRVRAESLFGVADFYPNNLRKLGHESLGIHFNNQSMQHAWARERGLTQAVRPRYKWRFRLRRKVVPWVSRELDPDWFFDVLTAQIGDFKPDILLNQDMDVVSPAYLRAIKPRVRMVVGQHAAMPLREDEDWSVYDLVISSFPPTIRWFRERGIPCELNRLGFDPRALSSVQGSSRTIPVSFVGSFFGVHSSRRALLEHVASSVPLGIWGQLQPGGFNGSPLAACYRGTAWGIEMYRVLASSRITINHHGNVPPYANNMRLYEATGMGTLLVTDWKENLHEMFEPGKEVVAYRSPKECVELVHYYLEHEQEREAIARAGQERTFREHTYYHRMQELVQIVEMHFHNDNCR